MLRGDRSLLHIGWNRTVLAVIVCSATLLAACGGTEEPAPASIAFADNEKAATLNGITIVCEPDGVTVHSEQQEIENIVLSVDGVHTRVDNIFAYDFVVAGAFDRMSVDSDPTIPGDSLAENRIDALWVKAGDNLSSDGPGYGQQMACPTPAVEAEREAAATKNYVEHEFGSGTPDADLAAVDVDEVAEPEPMEPQQDEVAEPEPAEPQRDEFAEPEPMEPQQGEVAEPEPTEPQQDEFAEPEPMEPQQDEVAEPEPAEPEPTESTGDDAAEEIAPAPAPVSLDDIGDGPQVLGARGEIVLTCGDEGIDLRAENADLASVVVFDNDADEDRRFTAIGARSLTLLGNFGDVAAVTVEGVEANVSCAVATRRADRGPAGP